MIDRSFYKPTTKEKEIAKEIESRASCKMTLNSNGGDDDGARNGSGSGGETPTSSSANTLYKGWILTCLLMINFIILGFFKENY